MTAERYAACHHVAASAQGDFSGPVDEVLEKLGTKRTVVVVVPGYPDAMRIARGSDLVATVPGVCLENNATHRSATPGLQSFALPLRLPEFTVSALWHPRMDADPAHRWLRNTVIAFCKKTRLFNGPAVAARARKFG